jgi:peptidoglycan-associated lipoprotein
MQITEDSTVWSVRNLMQPINSSGDDFSLSFVGRTNNGYFSSNRKDPKGRDKIYYFGEPVVEFALKGEVTDYRGNPLPEATIRIVGDDGTNKKLITKKDGTYSFPLNKQVNYVILASAKGHLNQYSDFSTVNVYKTQTYTKDFSLPSMGQPVRVDNIFFDFGKHTLTSDSESGLKVLVKMLTDNPHVTIEISAHTDHVGSDEFNMKLSQRRAQSVVDYLIENGIDAERLQSQGWGESKPVVVTEEMAKEHAFLKEGQSLDESFVMTLTEQEREIVTQINRRIEFVVLKTTYKMY